MDSMEKFQTDILMKVADSIQRIAFNQETIDEKLNKIAEKVEKGCVLNDKDHETLDKLYQRNKNIEEMLKALVDQLNKMEIKTCANSDMFSNLPDAVAKKVESTLSDKYNQVIQKHAVKIVSALLGTVGVLVTYILTQWGIPWLR